MILFYFLFFSCVYSQSEPEKIVRKFGKAFNAHNVDNMLICVSDSMTYAYVSGIKLFPETRTKQEFSKNMYAYFKMYPSVKSEFKDVFVTGAFVSVKERVFWMDKGKQVSQIALGVYEVRRGKIVHVWYFPSER